MATMTELSSTEEKNKYSQDTQVDEKLILRKGKLNLGYLVLGFYGGFFIYNVIIQRNEFIFCKLFNSFRKSDTINAHFANT